MSCTCHQYNKWLFTIYGLSFPLLITAVHFLVKSLLSRLTLWLLDLHPIVPLGTIHFAPYVGMGIVTAADIALSNLSFLFITVTYYTIVKSSVPMWILAFSVALRLV